MLLLEEEDADVENRAVDFLRLLSRRVGALGSFTPNDNLSHISARNAFGVGVVSLMLMVLLLSLSLLFGSSEWVSSPIPPPPPPPPPRPFPPSS